MSATRLTLCQVPGETPGPGRAPLPTYSPFCLKVHAALRLSSLSYTVENRANPAAFRHLNPAGQVPILIAGERIVADSSEILRFIQAQTEALTLSNARDEARAWQWEDYADSNLSTFVTAARWADTDNWSRTKRAYFAGMPRLLRAVVPALLRRRVLAALQGREGLRRGYTALWESFARTLDGLEHLAPLGSSDEPFWLGRASVADAALYGHLQALRTDLTPRQRDEVERRPRLCAYLNRVHDASFRGAASLDDINPGDADSQTLLRETKRERAAVWAAP